MIPTDLQILKYIFFEKPMYYFKIKPYLKWYSYQKLEELLKKHGENTSSRRDVLDQPLEELDYTIFDLETTGFIPEIGHEIISIGAIRIHGLDSCHRKTFHQLINPIRYVNRQTLKLTGLTREQLSNASPFFEGFREFLEFSEGSVLVAHPAKFDMRFLQAMLKRWKLPEYKPVVIDSQTMAQWLVPSVRYQLDPLLKHFQIQKKERHHALNDAMMTAELFHKLLTRSLEANVSTLQGLKSILYKQKKAKIPK